MMKNKNSDNVEDADLEINEGVEALKVEMEEDSSMKNNKDNIRCFKFLENLRGRMTRNIMLFLF